MYMYMCLHMNLFVTYTYMYMYALPEMFHGTQSIGHLTVGLGLVGTATANKFVARP